MVIKNVGSRTRGHAVTLTSGLTRFHRIACLDGALWLYRIGSRQVELWLQETDLETKLKNEQKHKEVMEHKFTGSKVGLWSRAHTGRGGG